MVEKKMVVSNLIISIITLNLNVLNVPMKRQRLPNWIFSKARPTRNAGQIQDANT